MKRLAIDSELLQRLYWQDRLSEQQIAEHLGTSAALVRKYMKFHSIPRRSISEACRLRPGKVFTKGMTPWNKGFGDYMKGGRNHFYGRTHSPAAKSKISEASRKPKSDEFRKRCSCRMRKQWSNPSFAESLQESLQQAAKRRWGNPSISKEELTELYCNRKLSTRSVASLLGVSDSFVCYWLGKYRIPLRTKKEAFELKVKEITISLHQKPNRAERKLIKLIEKEKLPYRYVGNGEVIIGTLNPDFININGSKQVIELFGEHWHSISDAPRRTECFRQYGFDTLIIWGNELSNPAEVIAKIKNFCEVLKNPSEVLG